MDVKEREKRQNGAKAAAATERPNLTDLRWRCRVNCLAEAMLQGHMSYGRGGDVEMPQVVHSMPQVPLLTNGQVDDIPQEQHALVPSFMGDGGKRIHPLPFSDPSVQVHPRSMDPSKDLTAYGYGMWRGRREWRVGSRGKRNCRSLGMRMVAKIEITTATGRIYHYQHERHGWGSRTNLCRS